MKKLPIAVSSFEVMRSADYYYVDKTKLLGQLNDQGRYFFLSRPRRFGKSLLLDTLHQLFAGKREFFHGLHIEPNWDWSVSYPVIRIDFGSGTLKSTEELNTRTFELLKENYQRYQMELPGQTDVPGLFTQLIHRLHEQTGQPVVVLIDEYDKPILDNIENEPVAQAMREGLKNLYSVLKTQDVHLRFVFMTGVSKFSKVSLFSGLNQLQDISLIPKYATICGYTQQDLQTVFAEALAGVDWAKLKQWYNGYNFLGEPVYNPYDILLFLSADQSYRNYWFETGSPSFLLKLFKQQQYFLPELSGIEVGEEILDSFDVEQIDPVTLLYQSGYLTIKETRRRMNDQLFFALKVPNQEVQQALNTHLAAGYAQHGSPTRASLQFKLYDALIEGDVGALAQHVKALFAGIPWRNYTNNELADSEGFYASVLYAFFASLNATIRAEDITNHGQTDLTVELGNYIYVMEIKRDTSQDYVAGAANPALEQIQQRGYSEKYLGSGKTVFEVGMVFNTQQRNLVQFNSVCVS
ncbi:ATP-binding protein [Salinibius halmophilus]|uniref:ATP-binding protein n=1 Tax=Salinibius halmophilus TaxID=1853216 RepID=UPI000E66B054|nr:ATP-binding protein [Salinibius halmophilus]